MNAIDVQLSDLKSLIDRVDGTGLISKRGKRCECVAAASPGFRCEYD
jgi:hypothetical protein